MCVCVFKFMLVFCCMSFGGNAWIQVSTMFAPPSRGFRSEGVDEAPKNSGNFQNFVEISNEHPLFFQGLAIKVSKHINFKKNGKAQKKIDVFVG